MDNLSFNIPDTPENRKAFEELKKESEKELFTLYGENAQGEVFPVANFTKHPDCPDGWFEHTLKTLLNLME